MEPNEKKRTLAIVQMASFRAFPVGGISTFVESIVPHLSEAFDLKLIGMSMGERLGEWTKVAVAGRSYDFLPIIRPGQSDVVPDRIRLACAVFENRAAIRKAQAGAFYVHMTEAAIPLVLWGEPVIVHVHGLYNLFRFSRHWLGAPFAKIYDMLYPQLFSRCAKVIGAGTGSEFDEFRRTMRVRSGAAIPTCVREKVFCPRDRAFMRSERGIRPNDTVLLYVGRMTETKNPALLLHAARLLKSEIPHLKLVFVGDGPMRVKLETEARNDPNVIFTGMLSSDETSCWMNAADALTVVSRTEAFTSIAALEALSCGTPVIATPVSALPDMIRAGVNGAVSDGFTAETYAAAVRKCLHQRPRSEDCRKSVEGYTSRSISGRVIQQIREVFDNAGGYHTCRL